MLNIVEDDVVGNPQAWGVSLDELARQGARRMLAEALEAEVEAYIEGHRQARDTAGKALVVRNGHAQSRSITTGSGTFEIRAPRINDKRVDESGHKKRFTSQILPPYMRRSPKVAEVLPILYLRGLSTGDFQPALESLLGKEAAGLSAANVSRLTNVWQKDYETFRKRDLSGTQYVYVWADGVHFNVRLDDDRLCTLVLIGVRADGHKELLAVEDGFRESAESWKAVLRDLGARGMRAPLLAIADGALGFWAASREVWPQTLEQLCWCHKLANVLDKLPDALQGKAKRMLREIMYAEKKADAQKAIEALRETFAAKYPKAVACVSDQPKLLTFFDFPAEHWAHLRTTNPIESPFSTVRLRQRVTKGAGSRSKAVLMAYKLLDMAQLRWNKIRGAKLIDAVLKGDKFVDGIAVKQEQQNAA